ncbi:EAL domain-containing protein [Noviherbaspirillum saxi]|nr:EAL domain-containing protein [Noviherbaspirillum saxi]
MVTAPDGSVPSQAPWPAGLDRERFYQYSLPFLAFWALAVLILSGVAWLYLLSAADHEKRHVEMAAMREAEILSRSYANHVSRTIEAIDQLTMYIRYGWKTSGDGFSLAGLGTATSLPMQLSFYVSIINSGGDRVTSTLPFEPANQVNVGEEAYFLAQKNAQDDPLFIGRPRYGILSKRTVVHFSRKLISDTGGFGGIVLVSVAPEYFIAGYDQLTLGANGLLAILGNDNNVRITRVGDRVYNPQSPAILAPLPLESDAGVLAVSGAPYFSDHRSRYIGWQATDRYSMVAVAGIDQHDALAPYLERRSGTIKSGLLANIIFAMLTLVAILFYARLSWRKRQLKELQETYRTATERGKDGFFIIRPILNAEEKINSFKVIDCNEQGARLMRHRREEVVGENILALFDEKNVQQVVDLLHVAYVKRHLEREIDVTDNRTFFPDWLHVLINRPDGDLAVTMRDISSTKAHVAELERIGNEDALTGLPNRHWLKQYLPQALASAQASRHLLALLFIDLDGFKAVNDTMGHDAGDELLRNAGKRLREAVRPHDYVVRIGGDEFIVVTENISDKDAAAHVAQRILHSFEAPFRLLQGVHSVGTSIGISIFPDDGQDADALINNADMAMYAVKTSGKRDFRYFDVRFFEAIQQKYRAEAELRHAIEHNQFVIYYQPRVSLATGETSSMEALVRWAHPSRGIVEPRSFIPLAEETGLIVELGEQVIDSVCSQLAFWTRQGHRVVPVSINVSAIQFAKINIGESLSAALRRHDVSAQLVEIELTESVMMAGNEAVSSVLTAIQGMGIRLLVDDFGTGYSSLSQLQELDFDTLKVDKAFTARLERSEASKIFYKAIITMAHSLGMKVVAEGVETLEQVHSLKALHCDEVQGFYIAPPMPPTERQSVLAPALSKMM